MSDYSELTRLARIDCEIDDEQVGSVVINSNRLLSSRGVEGMELRVQKKIRGIQIDLRVKRGVTIKKPVHLCLGVLRPSFIQRVRMRIVIEAGAAVKIIGHCIFPNPDGRVEHWMDARVDVGEGAQYTYLEEHVHNATGTTAVYPRARIVLAPFAKFTTGFMLLDGRAGTVELDYAITGAANSSADMLAKISASGQDRVRIVETALLTGEGATGVLRSKVAARDNAAIEVRNSLKAVAAHCRGHVDCTEILHGNGVVRAFPNIEVSHPKAEV